MATRSLLGSEPVNGQSVYRLSNLSKMGGNMGEVKTAASSMTVEAALKARHAVRSFLPTLVDSSLLRRAFEQARYAPSNCNTQPWLVKVVSGAA